jgi:hypothetical protein
MIDKTELYEAAKGRIGTIFLYGDCIMAFLGMGL